MKATVPPTPVGPLLRYYLDTGPPTLDELAREPRLGAILSAKTDWLNEPFLDAATETALADRLTRFYEQVVPLPLHRESLRRRTRLVRHGVNHQLRCFDPLPAKLERCVAPEGPYAVPGVGLAFWAAVAQACDPERVPGWAPEVAAGLERLGLLPGRREPPVHRFGRALAAYARLRLLGPELPAWRLDHFLTCVSAMRGRELPVRLDASDEGGLPLSGMRLIAHLTRQERTRQPLRSRVKEWGSRWQTLRERLETALSARDSAGVVAILAELAPEASCGPGRWPEAAEQLWQTDEPFGVMESLAHEAATNGLGFGPLVALLHLRDALRFPLWDDSVRGGYAVVADGFDPSAPPEQAYALFAEGVGELCRRCRLHPVEVHGLLAAAARHADETDTGAAARPAIGGFCSDTFRFLAELAENNRRAWMERQRERYHFAVREPTVELCRLLAERYVEPVLNREIGWGLVTEARTGKAVTSIVKNDYGQTVPYQPVLWVTFYRRGAGKRSDAQLFARLDRSGLAFGFHLGRSAREAGKRLRRNVQDHAELLFRTLRTTGALKACRFTSDGFEKQVQSAADLRAWAGGKTLLAERSLPPDAPLLRSEDLVGEVLLTFDQLLPLFAFAVEEDPRPLLEARYLAGSEADCSPEAFARATYLPGSWLDRALKLLDWKRQLILKGVPGTGKTHVAAHLARLLTGGRSENVRLVQFHPAYSYEEFVEGIKARTVELNGRHEVTYPVEEGVLCEFATKAAAKPGEPHVLLVDEINRGNLPRIFGELLYLLEYRDRTLTLPYSRREFRLPANLYVIGTMNSADRSVTQIDQALKRRFSFLDMPPEAKTLAAWLEAHPPAEGEAFGQRVVRLFESLNEQLAADFGPQCQVGHSYFMAPDLDESRLQVIWEHHVRPVLEEYGAGQPARRAAYQLDALLQRKPRRTARTEN